MGSVGCVNLKNGTEIRMKVLPGVREEATLGKDPERKHLRKFTCRVPKKARFAPCVVNSFVSFVHSTNRPTYALTTASIQ